MAIVERTAGEGLEGTGPRGGNGNFRLRRSQERYTRNLFRPEPFRAETDVTRVRDSGGLPTNFFLALVPNRENKYMVDFINIDLSP